MSHLQSGGSLLEPKHIVEIRYVRIHISNNIKYVVFDYILPMYIMILYHTTEDVSPEV